jgi:hypothetical protein
MDMPDEKDSGLKINRNMEEDFVESIVDNDLNRGG